MVDGILRFNLISNNEYWELLHNVNERYLSISQQYLKLLKLCQAKGVAFKDIRKHLMNEAKRCGLMTKTHKDSNGLQAWPSKAWLKQHKPAWWHCLNLFCQWVARNYVNYDVRLEEKKKRGIEEKKKEEGKKNISVSKRTDSDGNEVVTTTVTQDSSITSPVTQELSQDQVLTIITSNFELLQKYCEEKGATEEFKALMTKLGI